MDGMGVDDGGAGASSGMGTHSLINDAIVVMPTPDNSMTDDAYESRPKPISADRDSFYNTNMPLSPENSQLLPPIHSSQSSAHLSQVPSQPLPPSASASRQQQNMLPPLQPLSLPFSGGPVYASSSLPQTKSPTTAPPSNPFYTGAHRSSTPPISSSSEQSPIISPAKRFSSGEVKPATAAVPTSPRQPLTDEDRVKFTQLATQLKTRLTYAAIKVENGWEKHSFSQIQNILNEEQHNKPSSSSISTPSSRRRSHTIQETTPTSPNTARHHHLPLAPAALPDPPPGKLTYESFWASHSQHHHYPRSQQPSYTSSGPRHQPSSSSQPLFHHATFPRRKPERLSLQGIAGPIHPSSSRTQHTARDQSAAEIMIALASPRTRSEFSSPERGTNHASNVNANGDTDDDGSLGGVESPTDSLRRTKKRAELERDTEGLGMHT